jgi:hypothetical protein
LAILALLDKAEVSVAPDKLPHAVTNDGNHQTANHPTTLCILNPTSPNRCSKTSLTCNKPIFDGTLPNDAFNPCVSATRHQGQLQCDTANITGMPVEGIHNKVDAWETQPSNTMFALRTFFPLDVGTEQALDNEIIQSDGWSRWEWFHVAIANTIARTTSAIPEYYK